jgi:hypothetical protein
MSKAKTITLNDDESTTFQFVHGSFTIAFTVRFAEDSAALNVRGMWRGKTQEADPANLAVYPKSPTEVEIDVV